MTPKKISDLQMLVQALLKEIGVTGADVNEIINTSTARYLNDKQVESQYGLSRPWLRLKRREGGGPPFIRIAEGGGKILYERVAIESYLKSKEVVFD